MVLRKSFILFVALGVLAGCSSTSTPEGTDPLHAAEELVEPFDREQTDADKAFEVRADEGELGFASKTSRLLRDDDVALYWVSRSPNGEICLTTEISSKPVEELGEEPEGTLGSTCVSEAFFAVDGIGHKTSDSEGAVTAHLLPSDVSEESAAEVQEVVNTGFTEEPRVDYPYLLVSDKSHGFDEADITVERSPGGDILFWTSGA